MSRRDPDGDSGGGGNVGGFDPVAGSTGRFGSGPQGASVVSGGKSVAGGRVIIGGRTTGHVNVGRGTTARVPTRGTSPKSRQFGVLYHGTENTNLKRGDIVEARNPLQMSHDPNAPKVANASRKKAVANSYAKQQGAVYTVRPVNLFEAFKTTMQTRQDSPWKGQVNSKRGFKVTGKVPRTAQDKEPTDLVHLMKPKSKTEKKVAKQQAKKSPEQRAHEKSLA